MLQSLEETKKSSPDAVESKSFLSKIRQFTFGYTAVTSLMIVFVSLVISIFFFENATGK
jgi:hypothetical protein